MSKFKDATLLRESHPGRITAELVFEYVKNSPKNEIKIFLPGGRTVEKVGQAIIESGEERKAELSRMRFYQLDEFKPTPNRPESNFEVLKRCFLGELLEKGLINDEQISPFIYTDSISDDIKRYSLLSQEPDIVILGSGGGEHPNGTEDRGHVAAIFPEIQDLWLTTDSFVEFSGAPKPPSIRVTATPYFISNAKLVIGLILGEEKRNALNNFLNADLTDLDAPIKLVNNVDLGFLITDLEER